LGSSSSPCAAQRKINTGTGVIIRGFRCSIEEGFLPVKGNTTTHGRASASDYWYEGEEIDLTLLGRTEAIRDIGDWQNLLIQTPGGKRVTLGSVADIRLVSGPQQINHVERERSIIVRVIPPSRVPLETALDNIRSQVVAPLRDSGELGQFYDIELTGMADKLTGL
jgi:HAE1 family hydrophobic/amphiphilic exporter-1